MSATQTAYPISRPTGTCAATGQPIRVGDPFVATLVEREDQPLLERMDFSIAAWEGGARPMRPYRLFGSWRTVHQEGAGQRQALLSDPELMDLFEELSGAAEPRQVAFRYLLALLLIRRRMLKLIASTDAGLRVLPKGAAAEAEPVLVADPGLDDELMAEATEQLSQVLPQERAEIREKSAGGSSGAKAGRRGG